MAGLPTKNTLLSRPLFDNVGRPEIATQGQAYINKIRQEIELEYTKKLEKVRCEYEERIKEIEEYYSESGNTEQYIEQNKNDIIIDLLSDLVWHKEINLKARIKEIPDSFNNIKPLLTVIGLYLQMLSSQINNNNKNSFKEKVRELIASSETILGLKKHEILITRVSACEKSTVRKEMELVEKDIKINHNLTKEIPKRVNKSRMKKEEEFLPDPTDILRNN